LALGELACSPETACGAKVASGKKTRKPHHRGDPLAPLPETLTASNSAIAPVREAAVAQLRLAEAPSLPPSANGDRPEGASSSEAQSSSARERVATLASNAGIRLNHRAAWVLKVIAEEPALSNQEIAERAGAMAKSHASTLLARLARAGLIENTREHASSPIANAWRLTEQGRELERAICEGMPGLAKSRARARARSRGRKLDLASQPPPEPSAEDPARARLLRAALRVWDSEGEDGLAAESVVKVARASRVVFDRHFADDQACLLAAFEYAARQARIAVSSACDGRDGWLEQTRACLQALLAFLDANPAMARVLVIHSARSSGGLARRRAALLAEAAAALDDERGPKRAYPPALTAEALVAGALGVLQTRLNDRQGLLELAPALTSFLAMPYLGRDAARRELTRAPSDAPPTRKEALDMLQGVSGRAVRDRRALSALAAVANARGISNAEVASRARIRDQGQTSRILSRLARLGLIKNALEEDGLPRASNAWQLTRRGELLYGSAANHSGSAPEGAPEGRAITAGAVYVTATRFSPFRRPPSCRSARSSRRARTCVGPHLKRRTSS
jgi:DNA-binding MarR family transcriptional regulator